MDHNHTFHTINTWSEDFEAYAQFAWNESELKSIEALLGVNARVELIERGLN